VNANLQSLNLGQERSKDADGLAPPTAGKITLVTLVAILCNSILPGKAGYEQRSITTLSACQVNAQAGIAEWLANGPYHDWKLQGYKCVMGQYVPKNDL
jgi:hypothetical protein